MSAPTKKALENATKKVIPAASRAISASEAPSIQPTPSSSSTESSMPWKNGWLTSFLSSTLGPARYQSLRNKLVFAPQDIHDLQQMPTPSTKIPINKDGSITAQYRYPSPGSQNPTRQPNADKGETTEDPYSTSYFTRDTARRYQDPAFPNPELEEMKLALLNQDDPAVQEAKQKLEEGAKSSPGNKGMFATGKSDFDPTGLRATMMANHASLNKSLDANMPDHLPYPTWWNKQEEIVAWYKERNLPVPLGGTGWGTVSREGRIARW